MPPEPPPTPQPPRPPPPPPQEEGLVGQRVGHGQSLRVAVAEVGASGFRVEGYQNSYSKGHCNSYHTIHFDGLQGHHFC